MNDIISAALNAATLAGASYADVRVVDTSREAIQVASGVLEAVERSDSFGIGVRALADGAWGFASSREVTADQAVRVARQAVAIARASALVATAPVVLAPVAPARGTWNSTCAIDPFVISLEDKLGLLLATDEALRAQPEVAITKAHLDFFRERKWFGSTEGTLTEQSVVESRPASSLWPSPTAKCFLAPIPTPTAAAPRRRAGSSSSNSTSWATPRASPSRPPRCSRRRSWSRATRDLIIDGGQMSLQVHESIGHPTELDRVLGEEAAFAGTSFLRLDDVGSLQYGSPIVTVTSDSTVPGALGSFGWDDEGVAAQRDFLVRDGILTGFQSSRETAPVTGRREQRLHAR